MLGLAPIVAKLAPVLPEVQSHPQYWVGWDSAWGPDETVVTVFQAGRQQGKTLLMQQYLRSMVTMDVTGDYIFDGRVAEVVKAPVLKTGSPKGVVGSNPTSSSKFYE
jgi:hypothetical protein